jgi:hypothetical protein
MMIYFSIIPPPNLIAPNDRIALPPRSSPVEPPHIYLLRCVRVFLLVVVFELPVGGHIRQRRFFFQFFYLVQFAAQNEETPPPQPRPTAEPTPPPFPPHRGASSCMRRLVRGAPQRIPRI